MKLRHAAGYPVVLGLALALSVLGSQSVCAAPALAAFTGTGSLSGNSDITLFGIGFGSDPIVHFGSATPPALSATDTMMVFKLPSFSSGVAASPFAIPVSVADAMGSESNPLFFDYNAQPTLDSVSGASGPAVGGNFVTLLGDNFDQSGNLSVMFGGNSADVRQLSHGSIEVLAPPGLGEVGVTVNQFGLMSNPLTYTYIPFPPPVPEPTTALLVALGLAGLALHRRCRGHDHPGARA